MWGGICTFLINVLFLPSFLFLKFALAAQTLLLKTSHCPFLPHPFHPNKKRVANFSRRSTYAQQCCCLQAGKGGTSK
jgi:hypothetical protein